MPDLQSPVSSALNLVIENFENATSAPTKNPYYVSPIIKAKSGITMDMETGSVLYEKNADARLPIASITKLMTILIAMEENNLDETVKISTNAAHTEGSTMFLQTGEEIAMENLIYGALIGSANDAGIAIAEHNAGTVDEFVKKMNKKAKDLGLENTHFSTPVGLDRADNYSSARDVAKLAKIVYQSKFIKHAADLKILEVRSIDKKYTHKLESTNDLLGKFGVKGLKTGSTDAAGLCLVAIAENDDKHEIITVVLNSPDRFKETKILIDWIFRAYNW